MTTLVRFDPFEMMRDLERVFDAPVTPTRSWMPRIDAFDREGSLVVRAELPGIDPETVDVSVEAGVLTITGARSFERSEDDGDFQRKEIFEGTFKRTVRLPEGIDASAVSASSKDGILEVVVPKRPEVLPRKVSIEIQR